MKRIFDVVFSVIFFLILWPLFLVLSLAVVLTDGFPVYYVQRRVGLNGKEFGMFKFRSMVKGADSIGPYYTSKNDPRVTAIGRFIRRTSLDELPQVLNVLTGDMSFVGPRPNVIEQKKLYCESDWKSRNSVRPGITGLAQVSGRSDSVFEERLKQDLAYVKKHGLFLDIKILIETFRVVLKKKGAN